MRAELAEKGRGRMLDDPLFIVMAVAMIAVVAILMLGIGGFAKGGEFNRKHANRLMRYRIGAQFVAVLLILLFVWLRGGN
jgi:predicted membrane protein